MSHWQIRKLSHYVQSRPSLPEHLGTPLSGPHHPGLSSPGNLSVPPPPQMIHVFKDWFKCRSPAWHGSETQQMLLNLCLLNPHQCQTKEKASRRGAQHLRGAPPPGLPWRRRTLRRASQGEKPTVGSTQETGEVAPPLPMCMWNYWSYNCKCWRCGFHCSQHCIFII